MFGLDAGDNKASIAGSNGLSEDKSGTASLEKNSKAGNTFRPSSPDERDSRQNVTARGANSNSSDRVYMPQYREDSALSETQQLQQDLDLLFTNLTKCSGDNSENGRRKSADNIANLKHIINNALSLEKHNQVEELYPNACFIDTWLHENGEARTRILKEAGVEFDPVELPSTRAEGSTEIYFYDYLHALSRSGIMNCLEQCLKKLDLYLDGCDLRCDDSLLRGNQMQDGFCEVMLVICINNLKTEQFSEVQFYLDGDSNNNDVYFANKLDDDLFRQLFKIVKEAGGKVPEKMFSEYIDLPNDTITLPFFENSSL